MALDGTLICKSSGVKYGSLYTIFPLDSNKTPKQKCPQCPNCKHFPIKVGTPKPVIVIDFDDTLWKNGNIVISVSELNVLKRYATVILFTFATKEHLMKELDAVYQFDYILCDRGVDKKSILEIQFLVPHPISEFILIDDLQSNFDGRGTWIDGSNSDWYSKLLKILKLSSR